MNYNYFTPNLQHNPVQSAMFVYLLLFLFLHVIATHFLNKIRNLPPSPFPTLPLIGHLHLLKKPLHRSLSQLSTKHGPILLLQFGYRRVLLISSPSLAEECFTKNDVVFASCPRLLAGKHLGYNFTSLSWAPYGNHWRSLRKISSLEILSSHRLQLLSGIRSDEVRLLIRRLVRSKEEAGPVDMKCGFFELTLNVMMRMIAGKRYYGESVAEVAEARTFRGLVAETFQVAGASNFGDFLPLLAVVVGMEKGLMELAKKRDEFIQDLVEECRNKMDKERNKTMIEVLLALQEEEPELYKDEIIRSLMMVNSGFFCKFPPPLRSPRTTPPPPLFL